MHNHLPAVHMQHSAHCGCCSKRAGALILRLTRLAFVKKPMVSVSLSLQRERAFVHLLPWNARLVISDVDGTITKSDLLGRQRLLQIPAAALCMVQLGQDSSARI